MRYSREELIGHYNKQPAKRIGGMVLIFSPKGELLITKPTYKTGWSLVGGTVDEGESPLSAAVRETEEEVGIVLAAERFSFCGLRYAHPKEGMKDFIQVFFSVQLRQEELGAIKIREREISEFRFVAPSNIKDYTDHPRMQAVEALLQSSALTAYMENETVVSSAQLAS